MRNFQDIFIWTQTWRDFQICISVPLSKFDQKEREAWKHLYVIPDCWGLMRSGNNHFWIIKHTKNFIINDDTILILFYNSISKISSNDSLNSLNASYHHIETSQLTATFAFNQLGCINGKIRDGCSFLNASVECAQT